MISLFHQDLSLCHLFFPFLAHVLHSSHSAECFNSWFQTPSYFEKFSTHRLFDYSYWVHIIFQYRVTPFRNFHNIITDTSLYFIFHFDWRDYLMNLHRDGQFAFFRHIWQHAGSTKSLIHNAHVLKL